MTDYWNFMGPHQVPDLKLALSYFIIHGWVLVLKTIEPFERSSNATYCNVNNFAI